MCGTKLKVFSLGLVVCLLLQPLSLFSVELTEEEWEKVKNSYQILEIVTQERNDLRKDKETLMLNNEIILKDNEKLWSDNVSLSAKNESLEKENAELTNEKKELSNSLEKSLKVSNLESSLKTLKWCGITFALTSLGWAIYHYYDKNK